MLHVPAQLDDLERQQRTPGGGAPVCEIRPRFVQVLVQAGHQPRGSDRTAAERRAGHLCGARFDHVRERLRAGRQGGPSTAGSSTEGGRIQRGRTGAALPGRTDDPRGAAEGMLERARLYVAVGTGLPALDHAVGAALPVDHTRYGKMLKITIWCGQITLFYSVGPPANRLPVAGPAAASDPGCRL